MKIIQPITSELHSYVYWENGFTNSELDLLENLALSSYETGIAGGVTSDYRTSKVSWIHHNDEFEWLYNKLSYIVASLNIQFYRFDITGFGENIQLSKYDFHSKGKYEWHCDIGPHVVSRKLSIVLQLTDPSNYKGGDLQIISYDNKIINIKKQRGFLVMFPSFIPHQVTQVLEGSRQSLVSWISGPPFR